MTVRILIGDARERIRELPDNSVHCVVSSPPYFGLRDYGTGQWDGGDPGCDHVKGELRRGVNLAQSVVSTRGGAIKAADVGFISFGNVCGKCGARRVDHQIGLEDTPEDFVAELVALFRDVRRVLRSDGTLWLNLGDSYATTGGTSVAQQGAIFADRARGQQVVSRSKRMARGGGRWGGGNNAAPAPLKPKDLIGIPWRVAFALQSDGWWLRQDIIWSKPNPMPESVRDRCTKAHEYLFLLTKSDRYYFDADAIAEQASDATHPRKAADADAPTPSPKSAAYGSVLLELNPDYAAMAARRLRAEGGMLTDVRVEPAPVAQAAE